MGVGVVSHWMADKALALGTVAQVTAPGFPVSRPFYAVSPRGARSRAAEALADHLRRELERSRTARPDASAADAGCLLAARAAAAAHLRSRTDLQRQALATVTGTTGSVRGNHTASRVWKGDHMRRFITPPGIRRAVGFVLATIMVMSLAACSQPSRPRRRRRGQRRDPRVDHLDPGLGAVRRADPGVREGQPVLQDQGRRRRLRRRADARPEEGRRRPARPQPGRRDHVRRRRVRHRPQAGHVQRLPARRPRERSREDQGHDQRGRRVHQDRRRRRPRSCRAGTTPGRTPRSSRSGPPAPSSPPAPSTRGTCRQARPWA